MLILNTCLKRINANQNHMDFANHIKIPDLFLKYFVLIKNDLSK